MVAICPKPIQNGSLILLDQTNELGEKQKSGMTRLWVAWSLIRQNGYKSGVG